MLRRSRRGALKLIGGLALAPVLAACGGAAPPAPTTAPTPAGSARAAPTAEAKSAAQQVGAVQSTSSQPAAPGAVTLRFYTWTAAANLPAWKAGVEAFQQKYPKVQIQLDYTPGQQYWDKLTVEYAGGTPPDVIYASPADAERVATQGVVLDLANLIKDDKFPIEDINPQAQRPYQWGGKVWGICAFTDTRYLIYNKNLFKDAGLPELPQTWDGEFSIDTFVSYAKKLTDPSKQTWGYVFEDKQPAARWSWLFGGYYWDSMDYPTKAVMDSPESTEGFQFVQDMVQKLKIAPNPAANMGGSDPMFQTGKVGMIWAGFKSAAAIHPAIKDFEWGISTIPKGKRRVSNLSPNGFQVVSKTKLRDESWNLVKYLTADDGNVYLSKATSMPANRKIDFAKVSPLQPWQNKLLQDALTTGLPEVPHPNIKPQFWTIFNEEMDALLAGSKPAPDAVKSMASRINAAFQPYVVEK